MGKNHNLWHRVALTLEQSALDNGLSTQLVRPKPVASEYDFEPITPAKAQQQETLDSLCELYSLLKEEDMFCGIWQKRAKFQETNTAMAYAQHGFFEQARQTFEQV